MFQWAIANTIETNEELESFSKDIESLGKEIEDKKENQM